MAEYDEEELSKAFGLYDVEKVGRIQSNDLAKALKSFSSDIEATHEDLEEFKDRVKKRDKLTFDDFKDAVCWIELRQAFRRFDTDNRGWISPAMLREIVKPILEVDITEEELDQIILDADQDRNGQIDIKEFVDLMMS